MRSIRIAFRGFWPGFEASEFWRWRPYLATKYRFEVDERQPEVVVCSVFPDPRPVPRGAVRVFYTGEWAEPDMDQWHWAISFCHLDHPRHRREPLWVPHLQRTGLGWRGLIRRAETPEPPVAERFCAFIYSNDVPRRNAVFDLLSRYKRVDAPGRCRNNMPPIGPDPAAKLAFIGRYRFVFAFENRRAPGYATEKIVDPLLAGAVPLYWGDPRIGETFDTGSFLDRSACASDEEFVERIVALDRDESAYRAVRAHPCLRGNAVPAAHADGESLAWWDRVLAGAGELRSADAVFADQRDPG